LEDLEAISLEEARNKKYYIALEHHMKSFVDRLVNAAYGCGKKQQIED